MGNDIRNVAFDGTCWKIRIGPFKVPLLKLDMPKEEGKVDKIRRIGEQLADVLTPGIWDVGNGTLEMEAAVFSSEFLPRIPLHGANVFEFGITGQEAHPIVAGPYTAWLDRCRIMGLESAIEASEKGRIVKMPFLCVQVFHKGKDKKFKSLALQPSQPSPSAAAFLFANQ